VNKCAPLLKDNEICKQDSDCEIKYMCWYFTIAERDLATQIKRCLKRYSMANEMTFGWGASIESQIGDMEYNGRLCRSGLAMKVGSTN
jgi:hypothetical protein